MSDECVRHRDWKLGAVWEDEGGEYYVFAKCQECGETKSSLVDFTRDWADAGPTNEESYNRRVNTDGPERHV